MSRPISFLHGWGLTPAVWTPLIEHLQPRHICQTLALPGHGEMAEAVAPSDWVRQVADALPDDGILCGWSLGGQLALQIASEAPHKCARLILIGTSPCFVQHAGWPHGLEAATVHAFCTGFAHDPAATLKRFVALQALGDARRRAVAQALSAYLSPLDGQRQAVLADGLHRLCDTDLRGALGEVHMPVRLLHGSHDALMPVAGAIALADALPETRLTVFDDCGHAPFLSRPDDCAALIERFVDD